MSLHTREMPTQYNDPVATMEDTSSESAATACSSGSDENGPTAPPQPQKNSSRERMKAERAFLGKKVTELERELSALLAKRAVAQCAAPSPALRGLAKRQHARRLKAEEENERLKTRLLYQLQVAKSLETVLRNRASSYLEDVSNRGSESQGQSRYPVNDLAALHEKCMDEIDQVYAKVDSIFGDKVWADVTEHGPPSRTSTVVTQQENGRENLHVDLRTKCYAPFPLDRVCRATWRAITTEYGRQNRLIEQSSLTDEEYMCKFWLSHTPIMANEENRFSATITMRKFQEETRMVLVWRALDLKETPLGSSLYGEETGWLVVENALDPVTHQPSDDASTVRVWTRYVPIWNGESDTRTPPSRLLADTAADDAGDQLVSKDASQAVGEFTNHVLLGTEADIAAITEAIENILLDETIGSTDHDLELMVEELHMLSAGTAPNTETVALDFVL